MNVSSRCWSPFHANECVFSRNEQQKVYMLVKIGFLPFYEHGFLKPNLILSRFRIPIARGIPDSLSCIPDSKAQESRIHKQNFLDSGIRIPLHGATAYMRSDLCCVWSLHD